MGLFSLNSIKTKFASTAADIFSHSAHTVLSTATTALAFGFAGAVVGLGLGIADEVLLYNNITSHHYLTYSALAASMFPLFGASFLKSGFIMDVLEAAIVQSAVSSYFDQEDKLLVEPVAVSSTAEY